MAVEVVSGNSNATDDLRCRSALARCPAQQAATGPQTFSWLMESGAPPRASARRRGLRGRHPFRTRWTIRRRHQPGQDPLMALILLDSSLIFDHLNGRFGRTQFLDHLVAQQGHILACCPVNFTKVYAGLRPGEEDETAAFLNSLEYLPVTLGNRPASRSVAPGLAEEGLDPFLHRCDHRRCRSKQRCPAPH